MSRSDRPLDKGKNQPVDTSDAELEAALRRLGSEVLSEPVPDTLLDTLRRSPSVDRNHRNETAAGERDGEEAHQDQDPAHHGPKAEDGDG